MTLRVKVTGRTWLKLGSLTCYAQEQVNVQRVGNTLETKTDTLFIRKSDLIAEDVDGETIILNPENGDIYSLNRLGSCIWLLLESAQSITTVVALIAETWGTSEDACKGDVIKFFEQMKERNLIEPHTSDDAAS